MKKRVRVTWIASLVILLGALGCLGGCEVLEQGRFQQQDAQNIAGIIEKIDEEVSRILPQAKEVASEVAGETYVKEEDYHFENILKAVQAGNRVSAPWNPWSGTVEVILIGLGTIGGLFLRKKSKVAEAKYKAADVGTTSAVKKLAAMPDADITSAKVASLIYDEIGVARANGV